MGKKKLYYIYLKKKIICIHLKKKKKVINQYTQQTNRLRFYFIFYNNNELRTSKLTDLSFKPTDNQNYTTTQLRIPKHAKIIIIIANPSQNKKISNPSQSRKIPNYLERE